MSDLWKEVLSAVALVAKVMAICVLVTTLLGGILYVYAGL